MTGPELFGFIAGAAVITRLLSWALRKPLGDDVAMVVVSCGAVGLASLAETISFWESLAYPATAMAWAFLDTRVRKQRPSDDPPGKGSD